MNINVDQFLAGFKAVSKVKRYKNRYSNNSLLGLHIRTIDALTLGCYFVDENFKLRGFSVGCSPHDTHIAITVNFDDLRDTLKILDVDIAYIEVSDTHFLISDEKYVTQNTLTGITRLILLTDEFPPVEGIELTPYTFKPRKPVQQVKRTFPKHVPIPADAPIYQSLGAASDTHEAYISISREAAIARQRESVNYGRRIVDESKRRSSPFR